jgi:muramoyltetrapeptide carboxypeptidase
VIREARKVFVGYSDVTSVLSFHTGACGLVSFHGPMLVGRLGRRDAGYDRDSLLRATGRPEPLGELAPAGLETLRPGEATGVLVGGTLTQLLASLGTPFAFDPPPGCVLLLEDVGERPYRLDRMLTQARQAGWLSRARAVVFGEMVQCDEPNGELTARDVLADVLSDFPGPVLYGFPTGHTAGPAVTLPLGVSCRVVATPMPRLVIEEAAVS